MEQVETLQKAKRQLSRAEFEKKYPHPWLIRELEEDERPALFRTMVSNVKKSPSATTKKHPTGGGMAQALALDPGRYGLYPLIKSGSNPWSDRVLVGRASNNDIVLRNDRISKLHGYFQCGARGVWKLYDAKSANGTRIDGELVPPGEEGVEIRTGQVVMFGTLPCEIIGSGELYDSL
jgi:hypothetical protein